MKRTTIPDVVYGRKFGMGLMLDVLQPENPTGVGVIALSSGGWKSFPEMGKPQPEEFLRRGQTVCIVCHGSRPRFAIAEIVQDIRRSIRFVRAHATEYGIDPKRLGLFGISSGGNISLLTASQAGDGDAEAPDAIDRESDRVGAVACFYPPTDFVNYGEAGNLRLPYRGPEETDAEIDIARAASPVTHFSPAMPPTLIMHGDADDKVPFQQAERAIGRLTELGVPNRFERRPGKAHGWPDMAGEYALCAEWIDRWLGAR